MSNCYYSLEDYNRAKVAVSAAKDVVELWDEGSWDMEDLKRLVKALKRLKMYDEATIL